jgi:hypothetical protein
MKPKYVDGVCFDGTSAMIALFVKGVKFFTAKFAPKRKPVFGLKAQMI